MPRPHRENSPVLSVAQNSTLRLFLDGVAVCRCENPLSYKLALGAEVYGPESTSTVASLLWKIGQTRRISPVNSFRYNM